MSVAERNIGYEAESVIFCACVLNVLEKCVSRAAIISYDRLVSVLLSGVFMGHFSCGV